MTKGRLLRNTIANSVARFWGLALTFLLMPYIISHIGTEAYGVYLLAMALAGYFGLLDLGVGPSLVKNLAENLALGRKDRLAALTSTAFYLYLGLGMAAGLILFGLASLFLTIFKVPEELAGDARSVLMVLVAWVVLSWPLALFPNVLAGMQRYDVSALISFLSAGLSALATVGVLSAGLGVVGLAAAVSVSALAGSIATAFAARRLAPWLALRPRFAGRSALREILGFGGPYFFLQALDLLAYQTDRVILGLFKPVATVTFYEASAKLHGVPKAVYQMSQSALLPRSVELAAQEQMETFRNVFNAVTKYSVALIAPVAAVVALLAEPLLRFWLGEEFVSVTIATQVFVAFWLLNAVTGAPAVALIAVGKLRFLVWLAAARSLANLVLSLLLVGPLGVLGVILGTVIPNLLELPIFLHVALKSSGLDWRGFVSRSLLPGYLPTGFAALLLAITLSVRPPAGLMETGIYAALFISLALAVFYFFFIDAEERRGLRDQLSVGTRAPLVPEAADELVGRAPIK